MVKFLIQRIRVRFQVALSLKNTLQELLATITHRVSCKYICKLLQIYLQIKKFEKAVHCFENIFTKAIQSHLQKQICLPFPVELVGSSPRSYYYYFPAFWRVTVAAMMERWSLVD